jgi:hypothetical protein
MSRARWLAFGSTAFLFACGGQVESMPYQDAGTTTNGASATSDGSSASVQGRVCPTRSGAFACGSDYCDRGVQACDEGSCVSYDQLTTTCGDCPMCACLQIDSNCNCSDFTGAVVITCWHSPPSSSGGCYGAPPARLERIA